MPSDDADAASEPDRDPGDFRVCFPLHLETVRESAERLEETGEPYLMSDDAAVADVLEAINDRGDARKMHDLVIGDADPSALSYEDWVRPMKLTGGRVCLRFDWTGDYTAYLCRDGSGMLRVKRPNTPTPGHDDTWRPDQVKQALEVADVTPVLREDTPFAEVDDA